MSVQRSAFESRRGRRPEETAPRLDVGYQFIPPPTTYLSHFRHNAAMAQAKVDDKGRIAIPASLRRQVGMREGDKVTIDRDGSKLVIVIEPPVIRTVNSRGGWKKDPFPSTGEALFGS